MGIPPDGREDREKVAGSAIAYTAGEPGARRSRSAGRAGPPNRGRSEVVVDTLEELDPVTDAPIVHPVPLEPDPEDWDDGRPLDAPADVTASPTTGPLGTGGTAAAPATQGDISLPLSKNRDFKIVAIGQGVSAVGDSVNFTAMPLLVLALTGSGIQMGVVGVLTRLPDLLSGCLPGRSQTAGIAAG